MSFGFVYSGGYFSQEQPIFRKSTDVIWPEISSYYISLLEPEFRRKVNIFNTNPKSVTFFHCYQLVDSPFFSLFVLLLISMLINQCVHFYILTENVDFRAKFPLLANMYLEYQQRNLYYLLFFDKKNQTENQFA